MFGFCQWIELILAYLLRRGRRGFGSDLFERYSQHGTTKPAGRAYIAPPCSGSALRLYVSLDKCSVLPSPMITSAQAFSLDPPIC